MKANTLAPSSTEPAIADLSPLEEFYNLRGGPVPPVCRVEAEELPEPQRSLLAHQSDMTSTLERFHQQKLHVEVLGRHSAQNAYCREVVLRLDESGRRVEFGAIKIMLDHFPEEARALILAERQALGRILIDSGVDFSSRPSFYLRVNSDNFISRSLGLSGPQILYGRRNTLVDAWERPLAEIVEILPPT